MPYTLACVGGRAAYDLLQNKALSCERLGARATPFGDSQPIFHVRSTSGEFYFLSRHGEASYERSPSWINYRANVYALKDLGADAIVSWSETRGISHNFKIGQYVLVDDLVDETRSRQQTFFANRGIGHIRSWPVFCPTLRGVLHGVLAASSVEYAARGVYVCVEGPRHETPAETRKYAEYGGELLGQALVPEVFLARELQMCYTSLCYVARYAEDGTNYRPFEAGRALPVEVERERASAAVERIPGILDQFMRALAAHPRQCECESLMRPHIELGELGPDWRSWFSPASIGPGLDAR